MEGGAVGIAERIVLSGEHDIAETAVMKSIFTFVLLLGAFSIASAGSASSLLKDAQTGGLELKSAGKIAFGPDGLLLVSDPRDAAVVAIDTGDTGPREKLSVRLDDIVATLAEAAKSEKVNIVDMAVNPASGKVWFSVSAQPGNRPSLIVVSPNGFVEAVDLSGRSHVRMNLPAGENAQLRNVTDLAWGDDSVIVAGQSSEEFANKIYQIPSPLEHGINARFASAETYHVAHRKWETKAPIQSFIPWEEDGEFHVVGAFACTPIAKFPVSGIETGAKIKGTSVVELGSGNRPRDMFIYEKDGEQWLVTNTERFKENLFGPSKFWAARIKLAYLEADSPEETNENAARRDVNTPSGPEAKGMEVVSELFGAVHVSQLDNAEIVVLRETDPDDAEAPLALELVTLP